MNVEEEGKWVYVCWRQALGVRYSFAHQHGASRKSMRRKSKLLRGMLARKSINERNV